MGLVSDIWKGRIWRGCRWGGIVVVVVDQNLPGGVELRITRALGSFEKRKVNTCAPDLAHCRRRRRQRRHNPRRFILEIVQHIHRSPWLATGSLLNQYHRERKKRKVNSWLPLAFHMAHHRPQTFERHHQPTCIPTSHNTLTIPPFILRIFGS